MFCVPAGRLFLLSLSPLFLFFSPRSSHIGMLDVERGSRNRRREGEREGGNGQERKKKTLSESPSSSTSENNGIFTDPAQLLSPVKSTQTSRTSPGTSQRE